MNEANVHVERDGDIAVSSGIAIAGLEAGYNVLLLEQDGAALERRAMLAMVNEAALLLAEGVAAHATDVDVVLVNNCGHLRWEGGPVFWARDRGEAALLARLEELARLSGPGFVRGELRHLLEEGARA